MRLIDGDALKLCVQLEIDEARKIKASASVLVILNRFIDSINAQPTIEERKMGKWIDNINGIYSCDQCGTRRGRSNFCPNCGAKMEGKA